MPRSLPSTIRLRSSVSWVGHLFFDVSKRGLIRSSMISSKGASPMLIHLAHESDSVSDFRGGISATGNPSIGAGLRQIVSLTFDEVN